MTQLWTAAAAAKQTIAGAASGRQGNQGNTNEELLHQFIPPRIEIWITRWQLESP
ncbi:MAG: hypothetical protein MI725_18335 [Pirellulales bacterium]|nr:hypothetical protein [Pirellulales bacterium]